MRGVKQRCGLRVSTLSKFREIVSDLRSAERDGFGPDRVGPACALWPKLYPSAAAAALAALMPLSRPTRSLQSSAEVACCACPFSYSVHFSKSSIVTASNLLRASRQHAIGRFEATEATASLFWSSSFISVRIAADF